MSIDDRFFKIWMFRLQAHSWGQKIFTALLNTQIAHFHIKLALHVFIGCCVTQCASCVAERLIYASSDASDRPSLNCPRAGVTGRSWNDVLSWNLHKEAIVKSTMANLEVGFFRKQQNVDCKHSLNRKSLMKSATANTAYSWEEAVDDLKVLSEACLR